MFNLDNVIATVTSLNVDEENPEDETISTTEQLEQHLKKDEVEVQEIEDPKEDKKQEKKYTDDEVNRIVKKRLDQQAKKFEKKINPLSDIEKRELDITRRELKLEAKERLEKSGLPPVLAEYMTFDNKEDFEESYKNIETNLTKMCWEIRKMICAHYFGGAPKRRGNVGNDTDLKSAFAPKR